MNNVSESRQFHVYELHNPLTGTAFYVGKCSEYSNGITRLYEHIREAKQAVHRTHKNNTIFKILNAGYKPEFKIILSTINELEALNKERELIAHYGRKDNGTGILCNHTDGGEGMTGYRHSDDWKNSLREYNPGGIARSRKIFALKNDGTIAHEFRSASEASRYFNAANNTSICASAGQGIRRHWKAFGFFWRYADEYDPTESLGSGKPKGFSSPIYQYDEYGELITIWPSIIEVCRTIGVSRPTLLQAIKNSKNYKGFYWKR